LASNSLPSYICGEGSALALFSNKAWVLSNETTRHASQIVKYSWTSCGQQSAYSIWTIPCKEKTQTRRFKRDVVLPGSPATLSYSLHWAGAADNYVVDLFFNDKRVDHSTSPKSSFLLPKTASEKLHRGNNEIEIAVTKKEGQGSCDPSYGVVFSLYGLFWADLWVGQSNPVTYTRARAAQMRIRVGNKGPSTIYHATFDYNLNPGNDLGNGTYEFEILNLVSHGGDFVKSCEVFPPYKPVGAGNTYRVHCELGPMKPGVVGYIQVPIKFNPRQVPYNYATAHTWWNVGVLGQGPVDDLINNNFSNDMYFCDQVSSIPECKNLPE
jgi:hypothetical protein